MNHKGKKGMVYHDRGNLTQADFSRTNFTRDNAWHDLHLPTAIPSGVRLIRVKITVVASTTMKMISFRTKGNTGDFSTLNFITTVAAMMFEYSVDLWVDEDGFLEYRASADAFVILDFGILGWWE